ncbi:MAG: heterodisulfide reductase-related iron-sulfur binding cluster [Candidatus Hodarchaeaceae archaeon]|nr:heterodisulfide reductase-related iron-sulfur binding cluster [Candidatus Hodarchaeaceae archaeon]
MKRYALFLGCLIPQRIPSVELAARRVFERLNIEAVDLEGYTCCPDPIVARLMDRKMWLAYSARNLSLAEQHGLDLMTLCNGCFETLFEANEIMKREPQTKREINELLAQAGKKYEGRVNVKHVVEVLHEEVGVGQIKKLVERPMKLKLAVHPGCHLFREVEGGDIWRKPRELDELVLATGAKVVHCKLDRLCCGFPMMQANEELALKQNLSLKLACYRHLAVDGIVVPCPTCGIQFETGQVLLRKYGARYDIPCLHVVELLALALGVPADELALDLHRSPVPLLVQKVLTDV